ncbi:AlpA family transcriptional regulator [Roseivivax sp. THAF40]|uniref:helix-turn-helix transcriptional regulator n=1 Tax=Roseivivax sp. THAF40 TaxID=2587858 RepID=UPI001268965C|nr:hypothetical protein [Roseivivax sp. THAF40]
MTLWRWLQRPDLSFPKPAYIARRRYWREAEILAWLDEQAKPQEEASSEPIPFLRSMR